MKNVTLRLQGPVAEIRQIDARIWKVVPAGYLQRPAFYAVSDVKPALLPVAELAASKSIVPSFRTLQEARSFIAKKITGIHLHEFGELLYGADLWLKVNEVLEHRSEVEFDSRMNEHRGVA